MSEPTIEGNCFVCGKHILGAVIPEYLSAVNHLECVQKLKNDYDFLKHEHKRLCLLINNLCSGIPEHIKKHIDLGRMLERQFIKESKEFFEGESELQALP